MSRTVPAAKFTTLNWQTSENGVAVVQMQQYNSCNHDSNVITSRPSWQQSWVQVKRDCVRHKSLTEHAGQNHSPCGTSNNAGRRQYRWNAWLHSSHNSICSSSPFFRQILHFYNTSVQSSRIWHSSHTSDYCERNDRLCTPSALTVKYTATTHSQSFLILYKFIKRSASHVNMPNS